MRNENLFIPYLAIIILTIFGVTQCQRADNNENNAQNTADFLNDSIRYYKNKYGQEIAEKSVLIGYKNTLEILLSKQVDSTGQLKKLVSELKNVKTGGNITQITKIDTVKIPYEVPVPFEFERNFSLTEKHYSISGTSTHQGISLNDIKIPNTISFVVEKNKIKVVNSNPYIKTTGVDTYIYSHKQKRFGISAYVGYGLSADFTATPQVGIGLSYQLISF